MENCQCTGSSKRPPCSAIRPEACLAFNTHDDLSGLVFNQSSATKLFQFSYPDATLDEFTLFSTLPAELRLEIWKFACHVPRLIVISYTTVTDDEYHNPRLFIDALPPACLSVCRESRYEALKIYSQHLLTTRCSLPTYLNFASDWFLLGSPDPHVDIDYLMAILLPKDSHQVQFLHVSKGRWDNMAHWTHLRSRYPGLKEFTISFPDAAALAPYCYDTMAKGWSPHYKQKQVFNQLFCNRKGNMLWQPYFKLNIIKYDSPPENVIDQERYVSIRNLLAKYHITK